jgi:bifunctional non-homologous end joining protein LigD
MLLPSFVPPQIPKPADRVPIGGAWVYELKYDGYRIVAAANRAEVRLYNRRGLDWTARFDAIAAALGDLQLPGVLLDGEVCALDEKGRSSFPALRSGSGKLVYVVFDLLAEHGKDLRPTVLLDRKDRLRQLLERAPKSAPLLYARRERRRTDVPESVRLGLRGHCRQTRRSALPVRLGARLDQGQVSGV